MIIKNMKIRRMAALIVALTLASAILFACGDSEPVRAPENGEAPEVADINGEAAVEPAETEPTFARLPAVDYGGADFVIINLAGFDWIDVTLHVEEELGDMLSSEIWLRNRAIEDKFNVNISVIDVQTGQIATRVRNALRAGDEAFDILQESISWGPLAALAVENYIADANRLVSLDLANPWWDAFAHESTSILGKNFFLFGDFTIADKEYATVIFFNKDMQADYHLPDFYQLVRDGNWTVDTMLESMRVATVDLDGDGRWTAADQYGLITNVHSQFMLFYGAGQTIIRKDSDDRPYFAAGSEEFVNAFVRMWEFMNTDNTTAEAFALGTHQDTMFANGQALFNSSLLASIRGAQDTDFDTFRGVEHGFGILPPPKLTAAQERYYSFLDGISPAIAIVNNGTERLERTATVLEALNAKSREGVQRAYMEHALPYIFFRDEASHEMFELIMNYRVFDLGGIFNWGGFENGLRSLLVRNASPDMASFLDRNLTSAQAAMESDIERLLEN